MKDLHNKNLKNKFLIILQLSVARYVSGANAGRHNDVYGTKNKDSLENNKKQ